MLGKVHGPYLRSDGRQHVVVLLHNEDGSVKSRQTISYSKYLKELDEGLHVYESFNRPPPKRTPLAPEQIERNKSKQVMCTNCKNLTMSRLIRGVFLGYFCSDSCREKYKRKLLKKSKLIYYKQVVIPINSKKEDKYFIVIDTEVGKRIPYLISVDKCNTVITEDKNKVPLARLQFKVEDAVRVKPVPGFKKFFWISDNGLLISKRTKKILVNTTSHDGYATHVTRFGGRKGICHCFRIHRLVGLAFIPNPFNKPEINHIDCNKLNNHYANLEWVTSKENTEHAYKNGLITIYTGEDASNAKLTNDQAEQIRRLYNTGIYTHAMLADMFNVNRSVITSVLINRAYKKLSEYVI